MYDQTSTTVDMGTKSSLENSTSEKKQKLVIITVLLVLMAGFDLWQGALFFTSLVQNSVSETRTIIGLFSSLLITASLLCGGLGKTWLLIKIFRQKVFEIKLLDYIIIAQFVIALSWAIVGTINANQLGSTAAYRPLNMAGVVMMMLLFLSLIYFVVTLSLRFILKWAGKE